jgi:pyrroline-5-carboxylate reductase
VDQEDHINPVTAVSGGGPAYVFLLVEMLAQAAVAEGIPEPLAQRLARATVAGSGALLDASAEVPAAPLRQNVTSPGGTTAEALKVLMEDAGLPALMRRAIAAATARSRALSA